MVAQNMTFCVIWAKTDSDMTVETITGTIIVDTNIIQF